MQELLIVRYGRIIIQVNGEVYDDTLENFITDSGVRLPDEVEEIDYNKTNKSCWINGKAFQEFPNAFAERVLTQVETLNSNKEKREESERLANMTEEEKAAQELAQAKAERSEAVSKIIVEVDGMKFDGDEESQQRIARSIIALEDSETMPWVLYDNTIAKVTKEQLKQVLRLAGQKQTELWTVPYLQQ